MPKTEQALLVVGSVALDSVETPFGKAENVLVKCALHGGGGVICDVDTHDVLTLTATPFSVRIRKLSMRCPSASTPIVSHATASLLNPFIRL